MTARVNVSEKTLELNIATEILNAIRAQAGAGNALWIGLTQAQEKTHGYDEALANLPAAYYLALQFKAPRAADPDSEPFKFTINELQNDNLLTLAHQKPGAVHYVFPMINSVHGLHQASPNLLTQTTGYAVIQTAPSIGPGGAIRKGGGVGSLGSHTVECWADGDVVIHSEPYADSGSKLSALFAGLPELSGSQPTGLLSRDEVVSWLGQIEATNSAGHPLGHLLRGFRLVGMY